MGIAEALSILLGLLIVFLPIFLIWRTEKLVREEDARAKELIRAMDQREQETARRSQEMLERMDQRSEERSRRTGEMLFEWRRLDEEANKRFERLLSEMQETQRLTNALIKAEGEEVKALIKELLRESKA